MPHIVTLIPARSGSKAIKDKNLAQLLSHTLLEWTIRASLKVKSISRTIVSTDSRKYADLAESYGAEIPFLRPDSISQDGSKDSDFIFHALDFFESEGSMPDYIVHLRPTTPWRNPQKIEAALREFIGDDKWTSLRSIQEMSESAYKAFEVGENFKLQEIFTHNSNIENSNNFRQSFPKTFTANGYVDILRVKYMRSTGFIHGNNVKGYLTEPIIEIDSFADLEVIQSLTKISQQYKEKLF